jgi:hypothetical protein
MKTRFSAIVIMMLFLLSISALVPTVLFYSDSHSEGSVSEGINTKNVRVMLDEETQSNVQMNMMHFSPSVSSEDGIYYVCHRGADTVAYFGVSQVYYSVDDVSFPMEFQGSNKVIPVGEEPTGSVTNYIFGNVPERWRIGLADYAVLRYHEIYPGIDLIYRIQDGNMKYEFVVQPGADSNAILMRYSNANSIKISEDSVSVLKDGQVMQDTGLWAYQHCTGLEDVPCMFRSQDEFTVNFAVGEYDRSQNLVIDPAIHLAYSTFLGGSTHDYGRAIAVEAGYAYVTGYTSSSDFPTANAYDSTFNGNIDCFVAKFATDGQSLVYSTYLGGSNSEYGYAIAVEAGYAYITGCTSSSNFPTANAYDSTYNGGNEDCFVTKLATNGQSLVYSTFLGGSVYDCGYAIAVEAGCAYIIGTTSSSNFPTINAYNSTCNGAADCFVTKLATDGQSLVYSTFLGGSTNDYGRAIAVEAGYAYITGYTESSDFPTANAYDSTFNGNIDCFVTKLATDGLSLVHSTYLGGSNIEYGYAIAVEAGYAYVTGFTSSSDFPTINAYDSTYNGNEDCFVTKLATDGQSLVYSTFLGGSTDDSGLAIAVEAGYAYVTGYTSSSDFPTANAYDSTFNGNEDCIVAKLTTDGQSLVYSTYLGGSNSDYGFAIAVEAGCAYITGSTSSSDFPTINAYDSTYNGGNECYIAVLSPDSDSDGILDWDEVQYGTNPFCIDTDNDNFLDAYEIAYGSNATDPLSYPAIPQAWFNAIFDNLDGNATLIQNLISWSDGNATLLQTIMEQLDSNTTLLQQVISWLDGNHTAIETLFTYVDGNATLLMQTLNSLNGNATLLQQMVSWLDGNHTSIETLFTYTHGNATLLMQIVNTVNADSNELTLLAALVTQNSELLATLNATHINDIDEIYAILDALGIAVGDTDYDGLDDLQELALGTNLYCIDTDCDNLNDAYEVKIGTDPTNDDSDNDTYLDGAEVLVGTNPLDPNDYPGAPSATTTTTTSELPTGNDILLIIGVVGVLAIFMLLVVVRRRSTSKT